MTIDTEKMKHGITLFLEGLGLSLEDQHLIGTPDRIVRAWKDSFCSGYNQDPKDILKVAFDEKVDEMVIVKDISFVSTCAHHLVPFRGVAKVGYIPSDKVTGLSKLARVVDCFANRLQIQERLTNQIAEAIQLHLAPNGVGVIMEAEHLCMTTRGVLKPGSKTITSCLLGVFRTNKAARDEFLRF